MSEEDLEQIEFRTGKRWVPAYLAVELKLLDTHKMTYDQAIAAANEARMGRFLGDVQAQVVASHFAANRRKTWE